MNLARHQSLINWGTFGVSKVSGFVPEVQPLQVPKHKSLFPHYELAKNLPSVVESENFLELVEALPRTNIAEFIHDYEHIELATVIHAFLVNAYYCRINSEKKVIPSNVGVPFCELSEYLDRPPVLTIVNCEYYNWSLIDPNQNFHSENLQANFTFTGTSDESQFYMVANYVDYLGTPCIFSIFDLHEAAKKCDGNLAKQSLESIASALNHGSDALNYIYRRVDKSVFYFGFRKYMKAIDEVVFEGYSKEPFRKIMGASAVQSPLFRFLDYGIGIDHNDEMLTTILAYLKKEHRNLIVHANQNRPHNLREVVKELKKEEEWNSMIQALIRFRKKHAALVKNYILGPSGEADLVGTGGSNIDFFFENIIKRTSKKLFTN